MELLELVQEVDPGDGVLDLLCIDEGERAALLRSVTGLLSDGLELPPHVDLRQGKRLEVEWDGFPVHVDAEVRPQGMDWPDEPAQVKKGGTLTVEVRPGALRLLLPRLEHTVDTGAGG